MSFSSRVILFTSKAFFYSSIDNKKQLIIIIHQNYMNEQQIQEIIQHYHNLLTKQKVEYNQFDKMEPQQLSHLVQSYNQSFEDFRSTITQSIEVIKHFREIHKEQENKIVQQQGTIEIKTSEIVNLCEQIVKLKSNLTIVEQSQQNLKEQIHLFDLKLQNDEKNHLSESQSIKQEFLYLENQNKIYHQEVEQLKIKNKQLYFFLEQFQTKNQQLQDSYKNLTIENQEIIDELQKNYFLEIQQKHELEHLLIQKEREIQNILRQHSQKHGSSSNNEEKQFFPTHQSLNDENQTQDYQLKQDPSHKLLKLSEEMQLRQGQGTFGSGFQTYLYSRQNSVVSFDQKQENVVREELKQDSIRKRSIDFNEQKSLKRVKSNFVDSKMAKTWNNIEPMKKRDFKVDRVKFNQCEKKMKIQNKVYDEVISPEQKEPENDNSKRLQGDFAPLNSRITEVEQQNLNSSQLNNTKQLKSSPSSISSFSNKQFDPYEAHFLLIIQGIKIAEDEEGLLGILDLDMKPYYEEIKYRKIPLSKWYQWSKDKLLQVHRQINDVSDEESIQEQ